MAMTLAELARTIGAQVVGDGNVIVDGCGAIEHALPSQVTFLANVKYASHLQTTRAAAVLIDAKTVCPSHLVRLVCDDPYFGFRNAMIALHGFRRHPMPMSKEYQESPGSDASITVSPLAVVHSSARIGAKTIVHPRALIEEGAVIGKGCVLYPGVYVGPQATIGDECVLYPNVVVYDRCVLGNRVVLHANTVIGQDGFGYATYKGAHHKIPQNGIVVIGDDVEMGAGCAIERAAVGETRIGKGTKFADLISIGHGTKVGEHCLFVSFVGISGSVEVGNYVVLGGQVGVVGHLRIGNFVQAAGRTVIVQDVPDGLKIAGTPAQPIDQAKRNALAATDLYNLFKRVKRLERAMEKSDESARD